jgi:hypothetical protein
MPVWQNVRMRVNPAHRSGGAIFIALALAVSGCGSTVSSGAPGAPGASVASGVPGASAASVGPTSFASAGNSSSGAQSTQVVLTAIEGQVDSVRGLTAANPVTPVLLDSTGLVDKLTAINTAETNHQAMADESRLFVHLGLLPAGSSLEQMELALDAGQVVGFYDSVSKGLYVLSASGGAGPVEKVTFSHEYTHALQDQNFGLDKLAIDTPDQGDRDLARIALPEGDATLSMTQWSAQYMSALDLLVVAGQSLNSDQTQQLANAPAILRQDLMFPYDQGLAFVQSAYASGGWAAVNKIYTRPPSSTAQILHPELYKSAVEPVSVSLPALPRVLGSGWKATMQDTMGEFQLRVWLEGEKSTDAQAGVATAATKGWAGDRVGLYEGPNGAWAVVLRTAMTDDSGVSAFDNAAAARVATLSGYSVACREPGFVDVLVGSSKSVVDSFGVCPTAM